MPLINAVIERAGAISHQRGQLSCRLFMPDFEVKTTKSQTNVSAQSASCGPHCNIAASDGPRARAFSSGADHSARSVLAGSTRTARQAGMAHAIIDTPASSAMTLRYVTASRRDTPNSIASIA